MLLRYSNRGQTARTLGKLTELPEQSEVVLRRSVVELPRTARMPTPDEKQAIAAAYESGLTLRELGALFGFDRGTISSVVQHAGVETRYHQRTEVDLGRAERLHAEGLTITEVAERLGIGRTTLIRARRGRSMG